MQTNVLHFNSNIEPSPIQFKLSQTESKDDVVYCTFNLDKIAGCCCFIQILPLAEFYSGMYIVESLASSVFMQLLRESGDIWQFWGEKKY